MPIPGSPEEQLWFDTAHGSPRSITSRRNFAFAAQSAIRAPTIDFIGTRRGTSKSRNSGSYCAVILLARITSPQRLISLLSIAVAISGVSRPAG